MQQPNLTQSEIHRVVNHYIGVNDGYLGDFTYRTHHDFYLDLGLDIDPYQYDGSTRNRFVQILMGSAPSVQAQILRGVLDKYPLNSSNIRTQECFDQIMDYIKRLEGVKGVVSPAPLITTDAVDRAITNAQTLIETTGATDGVDRIHTALHGYLKAVCDVACITSKSSSTLNQLFHLLQTHHDSFKDLGTRSQDIKTILRSFNGVLDALNPLRNHASLAHPNRDLLEEPEAMLVINAARTILHYLDSRISSTRHPLK